MTSGPELSSGSSSDSDSFQRLLSELRRFSLTRMEVGVQNIVWRLFIALRVHHQRESADVQVPNYTPAGDDCEMNSENNFSVT